MLRRLLTTPIVYCKLCWFPNRPGDPYCMSCCAPL